MRNGEREGLPLDVADPVGPNHPRPPRDSGSPSPPPPPPSQPERAIGPSGDNRAIVAGCCCSHRDTLATHDEGLGGTISPLLARPSEGQQAHGTTEEEDPKDPQEREADGQGHGGSGEAVERRRVCGEDDREEQGGVLGEGKGRDGPEESVTGDPQGGVVGGGGREKVEGKPTMRVVEVTDLFRTMNGLKCTLFEAYTCCFGKAGEVSEAIPLRLRVVYSRIPLSLRRSSSYRNKRSFL